MVTFVNIEAEPDRVTAAAIARRAGVGRAAVSNWRRRYPDFPRPVPGGSLFSWAEVLSWLTVTGKAGQLATAGVTDTGTQRIGDAVRGVGAVPDAVPAERARADLTAAQLVARAMVALLPFPEDDPLGDDPAVEPPLVIDPACGDGSLLLAAADRFGDHAFLVGQDADEKAVAVAVAGLREHPFAPPYEVHTGDSLTDAQLDQYRATAAGVVCALPLDPRSWSATDPRWRFGVPEPADPELAWLQHCIALLRPRGVAVVRVPPRTGVRASGGAIRAALVRSGTLRDVITLPAEPGSADEPHVWVLHRPTPTTARAPVRLVDLAGLSDPAGLPDGAGAWEEVFADPGRSRAVPRLELLDGDTALLPARYLAPHLTSVGAELGRLTGRTQALYARLGHALPRPVPAAARTDRDVVTLAELERAGMLTIRARDTTPRAGDVLLRTQGRPPVVADGTAADEVGVAQVVEIVPEHLDSHFVALFLRADAAAVPVANTHGALSRDDLRRCRIPRMPLSEQRRYGDTFRHLLDLQEAMTALATVSVSLLDQTVHALTTGALAPFPRPERESIDPDPDRKREPVSSASSGPTHSTMAASIWSIADLLRGDYKRHEYGQVILPFTLLRRLDAVMAGTRDAVRARDAQLGIRNKQRLLEIAAKLPFYNTSAQDFTTIAADAGNVVKNLRDYINGFSPNVREILARFDLDTEITRLAEAKLLYKVVGRFRDMRDLDKLSNHDMGYVFEHLIRKFAEDSNETAGEHFTPREVIKLMVNLLIAPDADTVAGEGQVINILDPACGTGGMLTAAEDHIKGINPKAEVYLFGQEVNAESWAVCQSEMLMSSHRGKIVYGNSFSDDGHADRTFDYMLANPPFGVEWKKVKEQIEDEAELGYAGRFGAGLPRINDGSFLFLQHMISKMEPAERKGARIAIVFNGSPLFTGAAGSGESRIRQWILENDYLEGIVALPDQLFYNTGISTYFWILSNRKASELRGKVILLDARDQWEKMRKSLGDKRKQISDAQIAHVTSVYVDALAVAADPEHPDHARVKIFGTRDFGFHRITVERPLKQRFEITDDTLAALENAKPLARWDDRDALVEALRPLLGTVWWTKKDAGEALRAAARAASVPWPTSPASVVKAIWGAVAVSDPEGEVQTAKGEVLPDPDLRDYENIPLDEDIEEYFQREVKPHVDDAWIDHDKTRVGYEIPFTRHFYVYTPPRPLAEIDAELRELEAQIQKLLGEVTG